MMAALEEFPVLAADSRFSCGLSLEVWGFSRKPKPRVREELPAVLTS